MLSENMKKVQEMINEGEDLLKKLDMETELRLLKDGGIEEERSDIHLALLGMLMSSIAQDKMKEKLIKEVRGEHKSDMANLLLLTMRLKAFLNTSADLLNTIQAEKREDKESNGFENKNYRRFEH